MSFKIFLDDDECDNDDVDDIIIIITTTIASSNTITITIITIIIWQMINIIVVRNDPSSPGIAEQVSSHCRHRQRRGVSAESRRMCWITPNLQLFWHMSQSLQLPHPVIRSATIWQYMLECHGYRSLSSILNNMLKTLWNPWQLQYGSSKWLKHLSSSTWHVDRLWTCRRYFSFWPSPQS